MSNYGNSPYSGGLNILSSLLSAPLGKGIAESEALQSLLGKAGENEGIKKLLGGLGSTALGAGVGAIGGKHNIMPGAMSGATPYAMMSGLEYMKKPSGAKSDNDKPIGAGGQTSGASKMTTAKDQKGAAGMWPEEAKKAEAPKESEGIAKLIEMMQQQNDPEYQAMMMAPGMAGAFTGMGQTQAYNQYMQQQAQDAEAKRQGLENQSNQAIDNMYNQPFYYGGAGPYGYATGGYINTEDPMETGLGPMDRMPSAQPYPAASPQPGIVGLARGGAVRGNGSGMSDDIPASIDGEEDAKVADGEFIVPKATAEKLAAKLKAMMPAVRKAAHPVRGAQIKQGAAQRAFIKALTGVA